MEFLWRPEPQNPTNPINWSMINNRHPVETKIFTEHKRFLCHYPSKHFPGADRSVGGASDWKARHITDAGSSPRCGKGFCFQSQLSVQTLTAPVSKSHASTSVHTLKSRTLAVIPVFEHTKILHTLIGVGSAALAAAVPYPGKATRISRKGQWRTKIKSRRNKGIYRKN